MSDYPIRDIAQDAGWTDHTLASLLIAFLAEQGHAFEDKAAAFLKAIAEEDRSPYPPEETT